MMGRVRATKLILFLVVGSVPVRADERLFHRVSRDELRAEFERAQNDFDEAQQASAADPEGARHRFRSAAQRFESITASGIRNGKLEYNLGNCHLQAGEVGRAILHYRRAERLIPGDPQLQDNFRIAKGRCLTPIADSRNKIFWKNVLFWHYQLSVDSRTTFAIVSYIGVWCLLAIGLTIPLRWPKVGAIVSAFLCATLGVSVAVSRWQDRTAPEGVVTSPDTVVLKGPGAGYQRQFEQALQPGVQFLRREHRGTWWSIELPDGQSGWIDGTRSELVPWSEP